MNKKILLLLLVACAISICATFVSAQTCGWQGCNAVTLTSTAGSTTLASVSSSNANFTLQNTNVVAICGNGTGTATCLNATASASATCNSSVGVFCDARTFNLNLSNITGLTGGPGVSNLTQVIISTGSLPGRVVARLSNGVIFDGILTAPGKIEFGIIRTEFAADPVTDIHFDKSDPTHLYVTSIDGAGSVKLIDSERDLPTGAITWEQGVTIGNSNAAVDAEIADIYQQTGTTAILAGVNVVSGPNADRAVAIAGYHSSTASEVIFITGGTTGSEINIPSSFGETFIIGFVPDVSVNIVEETFGIVEGGVITVFGGNDHANSIGVGNIGVMSGYTTWPTLFVAPTMATFKGDLLAPIYPLGTGNVIATANERVLIPVVNGVTNKVNFIRITNTDSFDAGDIDIVILDSVTLAPHPASNDVVIDVNDNKDQFVFAGVDSAGGAFTGQGNSLGNINNVFTDPLDSNNNAITVDNAIFSRGTNPTIVGWQTSNSSIIAVLMGSNLVSAYELYGMLIDDAGFIQVNANGGHFGDYAYYVLGGRDLLNQTVYLDWKNTTLHLEATNPNGTTRFTTDKQVVIQTMHPDINILNFQLDFQSFNGTFDTTLGTCVNCSYDLSNGTCQAEVEKVWGMFQKYRLNMTLTTATPGGIGMTNLTLECRTANLTVVKNANCAGLFSTYGVGTDGCVSWLGVPGRSWVIGVNAGIGIDMTGFTSASFGMGNITPTATCEQIACEVTGVWQPGDDQEFVMNKTITVTAI